MIEHLSYSSISSYLLCGRSWRYKYIDKVPTQATPSLILGSAFHGTVEKLLSNEGAMAEETFESEFRTQLEMNGNAINWQGETADSVKADGLRLFKSKAILDGIKTIKPKFDDSGAMLERKVTLSVPNVPVPVIGYIDIILEDGTPADFKTAARRWTDDQAQKSLQSLFYLAAMHQAGEAINWKFEHIVFVKTKEPQFQRIEHYHKPTELFFLFDIIESVWRGIEAGVFIPVTDGWKCSPQFCDFWDVCKGATL
jgi:putative RecB family exonuclease